MMEMKRVLGTRMEMGAMETTRRRSPKRMPCLLSSSGTLCCNGRYYISFISCKRDCAGVVAERRLLLLLPVIRIKENYEASGNSCIRNTLSTNTTKTSVRTTTFSLPTWPTSVRDPDGRTLLWLVVMLLLLPSTVLSPELAWA